MAAEAARIDPAQAERLISGLREPELRASAELAVAAARAATDPATAAALLAERGATAGGRARTELAVALARAGQPAAAEAVIEASGTGRRGLPPTARARVAGALATAGAFASAERVVAGIGAALTRARALAELIAAAAGPEPATAARLLAELRNLLPHIDDPRAAADLLLSLGPPLAGAGTTGPAALAARLAERMLDAVPGRPEWVTARRLLARAARGDWTDLPAGLRRLADPDTVARTARELALIAAAAGAAERTAPLVAAIPDGRRRAEVLTVLARAALTAGQRERAAALARAAERTARAGADEERLAGAADQIVDGLIGIGDRAAAAALADRIGEPDRRESALGRVAAAEAAAGSVEPARALLERLTPTRRAWGLTGLAQRLVDTGATAAALATAEQAAALLEHIPDGFSRITVRLRLARAFARIGPVEPALAVLREADRDVAGLPDPDRQARALVLLAVAAAELGRPQWSVELHRRAGAALGAVAGEAGRSRLHARLAEALAETGHRDAAEHHLRQVSGPAARVRAGCAVAAANPARAHPLLAEATALVPTIEPAADRPPALARLAVTAATLARGPGAPVDPAWAGRAVSELLTGDAWVLAAPALAQLEPRAFRLMAAWLDEQLGPAGE